MAAKSGVDEDDADAGEEDGNSDASSVLGFGGDDSPVAPKRRASGKTKPESSARTPTPKKAAEKATEKAAEKAAAKKGAVPAPGPLDAAKKTMALLQQVDALSIWKGGLREADIAGRVKKASEALIALEKSTVSMDDGSQLLNNAMALSSELRDLVRLMPTMQQVLGKLRSAKKVSPLLHNAEFCEELVEVWQHCVMDADTLTAILTLLPPKLLHEAATL